MSKTVVKKPNAPTPRHNDLFYQLQLHTQDINSLHSKVTAEVNRAAHSEDADFVMLNKECDLCLSEFKRLSEWVFKLKPPVERRMSMLSLKSSSDIQDPIPAFCLQTVMILHLASNQSIPKRVEEIKEIELRRKDELNKLETWVNSAKERFTDIVSRFNLLCYMRDCLKKDGFLPRNIMYNSNIPQLVISPFIEPPKAASKIIPINSGRGMPQFTKEQQERDIEKRKNYLLQAKQTEIKK